ncbi:MAG: glycosyltransferase family 39 protein, partial [Syntrophales bacterium LBB04]|nr:glycosyltransferase family 39 protein [Syntrophales bacterium LBB04]
MLSQNCSDTAAPIPGSSSFIKGVSKYWPWVIVAIILSVIAFIRIRLLQMPLERDEGEFAYMGQLMLQGIPPYLYAYNMKLPGIYAAYALIMALFGQSATGIHLGLMLVNMTAVVLLFLMVRKLFGNIAAVVAAASYAFLSVSNTALGTAAHATQFIVPLVLGGTLLLLKALDSGRYGPIFIGGLLYGLAFLMKQHAVFFIFFSALFFTQQLLFCKLINWKYVLKGTALSAGASLIPFRLVCLALYAAGVFEKFWFWTFTYAQQYAAWMPLSSVPSLFAVYVPDAIQSWVW